MKEQKSNELDIIYLFSKFKKIAIGWIVLLFNAIDYILKKWIIITILIVIGLGLGYLTQDNYKPNKKATALVRINFDTVGYVYSEINLINEKVKEKDSVFFLKAKPIIFSSQTSHFPTCELNRNSHFLSEQKARDHLFFLI